MLQHFIKYIKYIKNINKTRNNFKKPSKKIMSGKMMNKKVHLNSAATLSIIEKKENEKQINQSKVEEIVKSFIKSNNGIEELFNYVKGANTRVFKLPFADKFLKVINEEEGFILPKSGLCALYLNLILEKKFSFKTKEMFVLRNYNVNIYAMCYQFYNWYSFKAGLLGFEEKTQEQFKDIYKICTTEKIETLSCEEILSLKTAIKRDIEAIDFVINLAKKKDMSKKALEKIKLKKRVAI